ncbi:MAG: MFS transporter [Candidatus Puniceispirillum sp.]
MIADALKERLSRAGIHYGWVMVAIAFLTTVFSSAVGSLPQILILPMIKEFGWNISDVSRATALMYVILASLCPFGAALMLRIGVVKVVLLSIMLNVVGLTLTVLAYEKWHLLVSIGVCLGIAAGIIGLGLASTIAIRWFNLKRGLVIGILTSAFAAGQLVFVPFMAWITTVFDWRFAVLPAMIGLSLCGVLYLLFGKDWPAELNVPAYGDKDIYVPPAQSSDNVVLISLTCLMTACRQPAFWVLAGTFFICGLTSTGIVGQHFIPFCGDNNVGIVLASSYLALMGVFNFIGTMGSGWLSDRFDNYKLLGVYYALRGVSLVYLPFSDFGVVAMTLWAIFFGLDFIATVPPTVRLIGKLFGTVNAPVVFGWVFAAHQFGSAVAAYGAGYSRDTLFSYAPAFLIAGAACFAATAMIMSYKAFGSKETHA